MCKGLKLIKSIKVNKRVLIEFYSFGVANVRSDWRCGTLGSVSV